MNKRTMCLSIGAAVFLVLASLSSAIVFASSQSQDQQQSVGSPLFEMRTLRSIGQQNDQSLRTMYLGKGVVSSLFLKRMSSTQAMTERGLQLLKTSPGLIEKTLRNMMQNREIQQTLQQNGLSEQQVLQYFNQIKNNPELLAEQCRDVLSLTPSGGGPKPMGLLNTSNPFACVIVIISLLPVLLVVGLIIATISLVTCLNLNNCFNNLMNNILQGLRQP
jgi:hypothetical protein